MLRAIQEARFGLARALRPLVGHRATTRQLALHLCRRCMHFAIILITILLVLAARTALRDGPALTIVLLGDWRRNGSFCTFLNMCARGRASLRFSRSGRQSITKAPMRSLRRYGHAKPQRQGDKNTFKRQFFFHALDYTANPLRPATSILDSGIRVFGLLPASNYELLFRQPNRLI